MVPPFRDIATALKAETDEIVDRAKYAEVAGAAIGLSPLSTALAVKEIRARAEALAGGYRLIGGLLWCEKLVRLLVRKAA